MIVALSAVPSAGGVHRNLAFHRPCTSSSARWGAPAGLVNGVVEWGHYALHTHHEHGGWVMVDLEATHPIGEVLVYGRGDGFLVEEGVPYTVTASLDGHSFQALGKCPVLMAQVSPCRVWGGGKPARYVRVEHPDSLVLSEVEVYGAR